MICRSARPTGGTAGPWAAGPTIIPACPTWACDPRAGARCWDLAKMGPRPMAVSRNGRLKGEGRWAGKPERQGGVEMNGKKWLTVGLSVLVSTAVAGTLPGMGVQSARAESVIARGLATGHGAQVQAARWGDASGEQGEVESPRWGDASGEQGEVESPRWGDASGEQGEVESPRWGDASGEQGEVESPRWGDASGEKGEVESPRSGYQGGDQTDAGSPRT